MFGNQHMTALYATEQYLTFLRDGHPKFMSVKLYQMGPIGLGVLVPLVSPVTISKRDQRFSVP